MASDFLKRKAREQAEQGIRTGTTVEEKEDGTMPSSDQKDQYISTRASSFLSKKAEEQAASVTQRYGEDAYGGSKWHSENSALSTDSLSQLLSQVQGLKTTGSSPDILKTSGGFYSRQTDGGDDLENIYGKVTYLPGALREYGLPLESAVSELKQAESNLKIIDTYLERAKQTYEASPTQRNADVYNQISSMYTQAYQDYTGKYDTYSTTWTKYKTVEDQVGQIMSAYQKYTGDQQKAFDHWRSSIRDAAAIQQELDAINAQIKKLEREDKLTGFGAFVSNAAENMLYGPGAPGGTHAGSDHSDQIRKLKQMQELLREELDWSQYYYYGGFADASDFAEMSRYVPQKRTERRAMDIMMDNYSGDASGWEDPLYEYINGNKEAGAYISNAAANNYGTDNAIGAFFGRATENKAESQQMTEQEVATFNYLYATQGKAAAHAYYDYLLADLNYRERKEQEKYWEKYSKENPAAASVFSVAMSPVKGLSYLGQAADLASDGEIDANAAYNKFSYVPSSIRGEVAKTIEDSGKWGSVGSFAYQTGLSMADFLFATGISGGNSALAMTIMGSGAAADTTLAATERGVEGWKAFTLGTLAGAAEAFTERFSIETLLNPKMLKDGTLKYILKNMITEGAEEGASDLINLFCDVLIAGDQSEWHQSIDAYMDDGMTEKEAFLAAFKDQALTVGLDILGGAMSGGILSSGNAMIQNNSNRWLAKKYDLKNVTENEAQEIIDSGLESGQDTESYKLAQQLQEKLDSGKIPTADELSRLLWATEQAIQTEEQDETSAAETDIESEGLRLRAVDDTEADNSVINQQQNVTDNGENITQQGQNVTAAPPSIAEQMRQNQNGGTQYENTQRAAGSATSRPAAETNIRRGAGLSDGIEGRYAGTGTAEQTGILESSPEQRRSAYADRNRATVARQNYARSLRLEKVSSLDLGLQNGTEARNIQVMPQESWDAEMSQLADRIYNETGKGVTYVMGRIQIRGTGGTVGYARGVITGDRIIVQADHLRIPMEQIADHEAYHAKVDFTDSRLNDEIRRYIVETFSEEQFRQVLDKYIVGLRGVIDVNEANTGAEFEAAVRQIEEEIFADAYAGINAFGAGADQFTDAVNERMDQLNMGKIRNQDNGVRETNGPPSDRYSYAGENANNADLDALARAKEMQAAGVADETIRQQTGWHTGMDGKWRWEIDDSGMRYDSSGDLRGAESAKWAMEDYESARDDLWGHADMDTLEKVRAYNRADIAGDETTKQELYDELVGGPHAYYFDQYVEAMARAKGARNAPAGGTLQDYIDHPALFEAYPQLRNVTLRFERMGGGMMGYYSRTDNEIVLNTELRYAAEDTLVHEIQHAIQKAEGFTRGSNEEYWQRRQDGDDAVHVYDAKIQDSEKKMDEIMRQLPENVAEQFRRWSSLEESSQEAMMLMQELGEGPYGELFNDYFMITWGLDEMRNYNYKRGPRDLYRNTAGEIEARDVTARRSLTPEQRSIQAPARADDRTVFVEDVDDVALAEMDAEYGPQMQSAAEFDQDTISGNIRQVAQMEPVTSISGQEFAKGEVDLITQVETFFNQRGNRAYSPELGEVILDRKGVKSDIAHGIGRKKAAAFAAVPDVIEHGLVVDYQKDWKGRGYDTAVVAAPITIGDQTHAAAVILLRSDQTNRFYVHEVLAMENGALPFKTGTREGYPGGDAPSILSILDKIRSVKNETAAQERFSVDDSDDLSLRLGERFSVDDVDSHGHSLTPEQQKFYAQSQARDSSGRLLVLYHQTDGDFTIFDTRHPGAGSRDSDTPFGIFLKRTAGDIGLAGKKQMALYANITNPLRAANREDLARQLREISRSYASISDKHKQLDAQYHAKFEQAKKAWRDYIIEWRAANPGANRSALYVDPKFNELFDAEDAIVDEWTAAADLLSTQAKEAITEDLRKAGYDGVFLENDVGSWGRRTDAIIALDPQQVKNISNKTPTVNPDIRYSVDDVGTEEYDALENEFKARQRGEKERFLREKLGDDGYAKFKEDRETRDRQKKEDAAIKAKVARQLETNRRKLHLKAETQKVDHEERRRLRDETKPVKAKKNLHNTVLNLFSIPNGQRAEVGAMIDSYADRLIKNGSLTEDDRKAFFDRMYDAGVMVMPAEEYSAFARSHIVDGRIYVSDSVKADFGDDWADIRRRAFAAGVYLVNDRSASGIDQWNATLSAEDMLPGLFDSEETDERTILERILQVAEEGKDEHLSLAEYTRRLSQQEGISEDEFLDNMERQLDWALRTFATSAGIEIETKEHEIRKQAGIRRQNLKLQATLAEERQERKEMAKRLRDRKELRDLQQRTLKQLQWLSRNRNRAPEELRATWDEVLGDIDLYAISAADEMRWSDKHNATWKDLAQMYKDAMKNDPNFLPSKELERIVTRLDATKIADMDLGALQDLYKAAIGLRTEFYNRNNVINDEMQRLFAEVYTDAKREIESAPGGFTGGVADKFLNLDQLTPMNVLQRMAGWDPDGAFYSMAKQLEQGERDMRAYSVKAQKMLQNFLTEHEDWVKKADGQGKDAIWYEVEVPQLLELGMGDKPIFGPTVKVYMTPSQKVHMYLESRNTDNLRHMTGGRTFVNKDLYSQGKRQEALSRGRTIKLAPETVRQLVSDLTPEEMELAQILDRYYNTFATQEINKVSNILYGYDKAMGKNYAPICVDKDLADGTIGIYDETAESVGHMKERKHSYTPSYNISAFDAFEMHVDQTARFCGMAIPARNWNTFLNWKVSEKGNLSGTKKMITKKWGKVSEKYIEDLIATLQGGNNAKSESVSSIASKLQNNYISAVFGANPSIVLKQLGSIPLAGAYLDARNMPTPAQISKIDRSLISKYTQELEWRTMGYATPETKQLKDNPNWTQTNKAFKFVFGGGAITAMDGWAASTLWPWAENKVRREHPELAVGTKAQIDAGESAFYKKVAEEFENAISRSQSVSDEIHQGTLRKSKNPITKAFTMFRSDSAQTYNALRQKIGEARYYMRTGAKEKVIQTAKKAAGTAFVAMLINAAWSEAISFLMALWKNKGKYYRDDEDELTAESVIGEMGRNMMESIMGTVTFGDEIAQLIGNAITGDRRYDLEAPGLEQINEIFNLVQDMLQGNFGRISEAADVVKNGGNLGEYLSDNSGEILGEIKDTATKVATYFGLPVNNVEAYLLGALKWVSPELGTAYDDLFQSIGKSDLAGMEGDALERRVGRILSDRNVSESDDTAAALAALYEAGYKTAIPSDTPASVSIDGEKHSLGAYQQQAYDTIWGGIVADALDDIVASDSFKEADLKTQAKMLSNLYTYAAEQAKAELFDEYELDSGATKNAAIVAAGATVAECITWNTITSEMKSSEKSAELASWDIPEEAKREIFRCKISDSREDSIAAFDEAGLSFDQFLQAYSMYGQINNEDLKAGMKAVEFSHWVNAQDYTAEQAAVVKDELTYFNMTPASSSRYDELVGAGMDPDEAYDLTGALNELQPEDGTDEVSDLQKWRASVDFSDDVEDQLVALSAVMSDAQFQKVEIANNFGVSPDAYVTLQEIKPQYDADGNGSYKNAEIKAAVDGLPGYYTTEQKAVLWQLATGSTSSRNNPYSRQVGQQVLDARAAAKEAAAQEQTDAPIDSTDDDSFSQALLDQLLGRG